MNANELRALADSIVYRDSLSIARAADYLRACADTQPVAWMHIDGRVVSAATMDQSYRDGGGMRSSLRDYTIPLYAHPAPAVPPGWKWVPVEPTPEMLVAARDWSIQKNGIGVGNDQATGCFQAMLAAAPAAPQAEPCIGNDPACPCQDGDACHYKDAADGTKAWPVPQAEPKLGELMREQRQSRIVAGAYPDGNPNAGAMMAQTRQAEPKRGLTCLWSRAVERAAYERAKQACMEIGKEIVCPEECAAAIDALGGSDGN